MRWVREILLKKGVFCATVISIREYNQERYQEYGKITFANSSFTLGFIPLMMKVVLGVDSQRINKTSYIVSLWLHSLRTTTTIIIIFFLLKTALSWPGI